MAKKVFFSFHYQDVIDFRANVVRNSGFIKERGNAGFLDSSIWEESKSKSITSLKKLIDDNLDGTSCTTILVGEHTYSRRWVKYEIFKSIQKGNRILGIHINKIPCKQSKTKSHGKNPFEHLALQVDSKGENITPYEWDGINSKWIPYTDISSWPLSTPQPSRAGDFKQLTHWHKIYCWVDNDGYNKFKDWLD